MTPDAILSALNTAPYGSRQLLDAVEAADERGLPGVEETLDELLARRFPPKVPNETEEERLRAEAEANAWWEEMVGHFRQVGVTKTTARRPKGKPRPVAHYPLPVLDKPIRRKPRGSEIMHESEGEFAGFNRYP